MVFLIVNLLSRRRSKLIVSCFALLNLVFLTNGCTFNSTYLNEERERRVAESVTDSLYEFVQQQRFSEAGELFSEAFFKVTGKEELHDMFTNTQRVLGEYRERDLVDWRTKRVVGTDPYAEYVLVYDVIYSRFSARETIWLSKERYGIKIIGYNVNSEGFLKQ